jgi:hypothetical protein
MYSLFFMFLRCFETLTGAYDPCAHAYGPYEITVGGIEEPFQTFFFFHLPFKLPPLSSNRPHPHLNPSLSLILPSSSFSHPYSSPSQFLNSLPLLLPIPLPFFSLSLSSPFSPLTPHLSQTSMQPSKHRRISPVKEHDMRIMVTSTIRKSHHSVSSPS